MHSVLLFANAENGAWNPRLETVCGSGVFADGSRAGCTLCRRRLLVAGERFPFLLQRRKFFDFIFGRWLLGWQTWMLWLRTAVLRLRTGSNAAVLYVRERTLSFSSCRAFQNRSHWFGRRRHRGGLPHLALKHVRKFPSREMNWFPYC